jgi:hypothetical protein
VLCPHTGLQVGGRCYFCLKVAATNGHRDRLTAEQLGFVGFGLDRVPADAAPASRVAGWLPAAARHERIDKQLEELARLRDIAPGWIALARELVKDDEEK